jgi:hypothetical protein
MFYFLHLTLPLTTFCFHPQQNLLLFSFFLHPHLDYPLPLRLLKHLIQTLLSFNHLPGHGIFTDQFVLILIIFKSKVLHTLMHQFSVLHRHLLCDSLALVLVKNLEDELGGAGEVRVGGGWQGRLQGAH